MPCDLSRLWPLPRYLTATPVEHQPCIRNRPKNITPTANKHISQPAMFPLTKAVPKSARRQQQPLFPTSSMSAVSAWLDKIPNLKTDAPRHCARPGCYEMSCPDDDYCRPRGFTTYPQVIQHCPQPIHLPTKELQYQMLQSADLQDNHRLLPPLPQCPINSPVPERPGLLRLL